MLEMLESQAWYESNDVLMTIRCTNSKYARAFVEKGQVKFSTPQSWVDWEKKNAKGRGDLKEGTLAFFDISDADNAIKLLKKYNDQNLYSYEKIKNRCYIKSKRNMDLPSLCFFGLKYSNLNVPSCVGRQKIFATIDEKYFRDFADNMTPKQEAALQEDEKSAIVALNDSGEFISRLIKKLTGMGLEKNEILIRHIKYENYNEYGDESWLDLCVEPPDELFIKDTDFCYQNEFRIVINTNKSDIRKLLHENQIEIGLLDDIAICNTGYPYKGIKVEMDATVYKDGD